MLIFAGQYPKPLNCSESLNAGSISLLFASMEDRLGQGSSRQTPPSQPPAQAGEVNPQPVASVKDFNSPEISSTFSADFLVSSKTNVLLAILFAENKSSINPPRGISV